MQVDGTSRTVIIDIGVEIEPRVEKSRESTVAGFVYREPLGCKEGIMHQALAIDRSRVNPAHVRVPRHIVEIIESKNAAGQRLQKTHPFRLAVILPAVFFDWERDVLRSQFFASSERTARTTTKLADDIAEVFLNDGLTQVLMGEIVVAEKIIIEKMAERSVADIVQEPCDAHVLFDKRC